MKKLGLIIAACALSTTLTTAFADITVYTNSHNVADNSTFTGKITRVVVYADSVVGVFVQRTAEVNSTVGIQFNGNQAQLGATLANMVGKTLSFDTHYNKATRQYDVNNITFSMTPLNS